MSSAAPAEPRVSGSLAAPTGPALLPQHTGAAGAEGNTRRRTSQRCNLLQQVPLPVSPHVGLDVRHPCLEALTGLPARRTTRTAPRQVAGMTPDARLAMQTPAESSVRQASWRAAGVLGDVTTPGARRNLSLVIACAHWHYERQRKSLPPQTPAQSRTLPEKHTPSHPRSSPSPLQTPHRSLAAPPPQSLMGGPPPGFAGGVTGAVASQTALAETALRCVRKSRTLVSRSVNRIRTSRAPACGPQKGRRQRGTQCRQALTALRTAL